MNIPQQLKLPQRLIREYDRPIIQHMRTWEKIEKKTARERNHLHYTLHCKHRRVFPPSLTVKTAVRGRNADKIIHRTQVALLNERIRQIYYRLDILGKQIVDAQEFLFTHVANDIYDEISLWVAHARHAEWERCRARQQRKFAKLWEKKMAKDQQAKPKDILADVSAEDTC